MNTAVRRKWFVLLVAVLLVMALTVPALAGNGGDVVVTDQPYLRHDEGTDAAIASCSDSDTDEAGGNRQQNEPSVAIHPSEPDVMVAGSNDYCTVPTFGDAWMGFYVSEDGGSTWVNSLNPGYPGDDSAEGQASPIFGEVTASGDPIMDWDNEDRLFYGGIAFNRTASNDPAGASQPTNGHVIVSTWERDPDAEIGMDYLRTVIVGEGTPGAFPFSGHFNDKPSLRVDDWTDSPHEGNVYVAWTLFPGFGQDQILFSRSTDGGQTFSKPLKISQGLASAQGSDIAVAPDGTVYIVWRQFNQVDASTKNAIVFIKSTDGGASFSDPEVITTIAPYDRQDVSDGGSAVRDCGDGPFHCQSDFVFHRVATLPQAVVDGQGHVHVTWEQVVPVEDNGDTYRPDGRAQVVVTKSTNGGSNWAPPVPADDQPGRHQWWPNLEYDRSKDTLLLIYYGSGGGDDDFSANRPPGNTANGVSTCGAPGTAVCDVLNAFIATSTDGVTWTPMQASSQGHQPNYEMFGNRDIPFHGDYLWVDANGGKVFGVWADNRDVVPGTDPREAMQDGFDVNQCRATASSPDTCPNAGGLNQNIYGFGFSLE